MSKQIKVRYTFEVERTVTISSKTPPKPYDQEEWEKQQIEDVGNDMEFALEGNINWRYRRLDE